MVSRGVLTGAPVRGAEEGGGEMEGSLSGVGTPSTRRGMAAGRAVGVADDATTEADSPGEGGCVEPGSGAGSEGGGTTAGAGASLPDPRRGSATPGSATAGTPGGAGDVT